MNRRTLALIYSIGALVFFSFIAYYGLTSVFHIKTLSNYKTIISFQNIGLLALALLIFESCSGNKIKIGYFVPLIAITVVYLLILEYIIVLGISQMSNETFVFANLVLLFIYYLISMPMYIIGKK